MPNKTDAPSRVLVPIANPESVGDLLEMGFCLAEPEHGKVSALFVTLGNLEAETEALDDIEPIVEKLKDDGQPVELETRKANNVARGILEAARDLDADMIILGLAYRARGRTDLGPIVENVLITAACDVIIYRLSDSKVFKRVVIPADGSPPARAAARLGAALAVRLNVGAEAMYVQEGYRSRWEGLGRIEQSLEDVSESRHVRRTLITAHDPVDGILARVNEDDLVVVGYTGRNQVERWLFGDFSRRMLEQGQCSVLLVAHITRVSTPLGRVTAGLKRYSIRLTPAEQDDISRQGYHTSAANVDYLILIMIAATLASLGLLVNSTAVIIGAMLVAPFMQPCIAASIGIVVWRGRLVRRALVTLGVGVALALAVAALCGLLRTGTNPTPEMLSRTHPTYLDVLVALASGLMGGYATARKEIPSALAGVAIAAALMPPLCTAGLELTAGRPANGLQAALLFSINVVCIIVAALAVFFLMGMRRDPGNGTERA